MVAVVVFTPTAQPSSMARQTFVPTVSDVGVIPKLHMSGITVTAKDLQEGASVSITMATPGVFMTGCGDLTAFFKAFDSAYEVVYDGTDMILRKK